MNPQLLKQLKWIHKTFDSVAFKTKPKLYLQMARHFNVRSFSHAPVGHRDYVSFRDTLIQITKDKYALLIADVKCETETKAIEVEVLHTIPKVGRQIVYKYPDQKCELIHDVCNQPKAAKELWDNIIAGRRGQALVAIGGIGKTFILGCVIKNFIEQGMIQECKCYSPWPIIYVTKMSVVEQTKSVLRLFGLKLGEDVCVFNIETLRTDFGRFFVEKDLQIIAGREILFHQWNPKFLPCLVIWDEYHMFARPESEQSKIACALNDIEDVPIFQIGSTATLMAKVSDCKHLMVSTRMKFDWNGKQVTVNNKNWKHLAGDISYPYHPDVYAEGSVKNFMERFRDYIVEVTDIKQKFHSHVTTQGIIFKTKEEREIVENAIENFYIKKAKIEGSGTMSAAQMAFAILAEFTILRKACEVARAPQIATAVNASWLAGKAPAVGAAFKNTIVTIYKHLVEDYGWERDDVSFIWGGSTESLNDKQKLHKQIKDKGLEEKLKTMGITYADLGIDLFNLNEKTNEQYEFEKKHKLLSQKPVEREKERLRFQRQDSRALLFSYKSGGVGLSAHHERIYPNAKQREGFFTPIYSEKEMLQALWRLHRITSISDTNQKVIHYLNTIEDHVMEKLIMKLKCARHVGASESWESIITNRKVIEDELIEVEDVND